MLVKLMDDGLYRVFCFLFYPFYFRRWRSAFFKKLKSLTGFAPVDLVKEIRLNKSIELIKNSDMSISEIAFAVGFKDSGYFSKCFRKKYDQTPREYMNEWRKS